MFKTIVWAIIGIGTGLLLLYWASQLMEFIHDTERAIGQLIQEVKRMECKQNDMEKELYTHYMRTRNINPGDGN